MVAKRVAPCSDWKVPEILSWILIVLNDLSASSLVRHSGIVEDAHDVGVAGADSGGEVEGLGVGRGSSRRCDDGGVRCRRGGAPRRRRGRRGNRLGSARRGRGHGGAVAAAVDAPRARRKIPAIWASRPRRRWSGRRRRGGAGGERRIGRGPRW